MGTEVVRVRSAVVSVGFGVWGFELGSGSGGVARRQQGRREGVEHGEVVARLVGVHEGFDALVAEAMAYRAEGLVLGDALRLR